MAHDPEKPESTGDDLGETQDHEPTRNEDQAKATEAFTRTENHDFETQVTDVDAHNAPTIEAGAQSNQPGTAQTVVSDGLQNRSQGGSQSKSHSGSQSGSQVPSQIPSFGDRLGSSAPMVTDGRIGHFHIIEELGSGGFGTVVRARDTQLDRDVAIKIIKSASLANNPRMISKFKDEARAAASLRHPNIVPVYQSGDYGLDQTFIVFDYVRGKTLRRVFRKRKLSLRQSVEMLAKIADALGYAHSCGIVHRDVKPENILIDDDRSEPHIADFGCARRRQYDATDDLETASEVRKEKPVRKRKVSYYIGTPSYFSPEQASGNSHIADARTDVWAVGIIMDEMLSGRRTFRDAESSKSQLMEQIIHHEPESLLTRCRAKQRPIDADLDAIWKCCLSKEPARRYTTAADLNEDLERWLRGDPVSVRPLGPVERMTRWAKKNPSTAALIATVFATVTVGFLVSSFFWVGELQAKRAQVETYIGSLLDANPDGVSEIFRALEQARLRDIAFGMLHDRWESDEHVNAHRIALAMNRFPESLGMETQRQIDEQLSQAVLAANPRELQLITDQLYESSELADGFFDVVVADGESPSRRLRALATVLADAPDKIVADDDSLVRDDPRLGTLAADCVQWLNGEDFSDLENWVSLLKPIRGPLTIPLETAVSTEKGPSRRIAATVLFDYYDDDPDWLLQRVFDTDLELMDDLLLRLHRCVHRDGGLSVASFAAKLQDAANNVGGEVTLSGPEVDARYWLTLFYIRKVDSVLDAALHSHSDPTRMALLEREVAEFGIPLKKLMDLITQLVENNTRNDLLFHGLLALGSYEPPASGLEEIEATLGNLFRTHPDAGIHSAAGWILHQWGRPLPEESELPQSYEGDRNWRVSNANETFVRINRPESVRIGSPLEERELYGLTRRDYQDEDDSERLHRRQLAFDFEISSHEVTVAAFKEFLDEREDYFEQLYERSDVPERTELQEKEFERANAALSSIGTRQLELTTRDLQTPVVSIAWHDAVEYCIWRSEREGLSSCYGTLPELTNAKQRETLIATDLSKNGYRLPTIGEWEYACRSGSATPWPFGQDPSLIGDYAVHRANSRDRTQPIGRRKPNRFGVFDMLGNAAEWTTSTLNSYPNSDSSELTLIVEPPLLKPKPEDVVCEIRGGSFQDTAKDMRSAVRYYSDATAPLETTGFRIIRSLPAE